MAEYNKGFLADTKRSVVSAINTSVTGAATTVLGDLNRWREVLENNPKELPFKLPPTFQQELDKIKPYTDLVGLKLPIDNVESDLKKALAGLAKPVVIDSISTVKQLSKESQTILSKIAWLG